MSEFFLVYKDFLNESVLELTNMFSEIFILKLYFYLILILKKICIVYCN